MSLTWRFVEAGTCLFGDRLRPIAVPALWWTATPVTYTDLGSGPGTDIPVTMVDWDGASNLARQLGGRLPRSVEWEWMAAGPGRRRYPWGDHEWAPGKAVLVPAGHEQPQTAGSCPLGATPEGLLDVAGNVWEWTATTVLGGGAVIRGGSYASPPLYAQCTFLNAAPAELRSPGIGFRLVREP
ncbi:SUMF1/EgtB/PvdO family nonheme iron enzyme [Pseudofrankia sp. DC12]|uniref:formylglycine-generating enzyme family protein n=1 Tax=Pseudofrankia sp. DC12 TaxID=683315 RepID=UPI0005F88E5C|nr:SUMF1/EgtB/PvdO family nonheme iron enzyme [Pseudofrankia sp. DC12]